MFARRGFGGGMPFRGGGRGRDAYAMLLLAQLAHQVWMLPNKPPVTVALMALLSALHFGAPSGAASAAGAFCLRPASLAAAGWLTPTALRRLVMSPLIHASDYHLAYNLSSLLWKGASLEAQGSVRFAAMLAVLSVLTPVAQVLLSGAAAAVGFSDWWWECSVGCSGVLFALKTVSTYDDPGQSHVMGFAVPSRWAAWAELALLYFFMPSSSFVGHLAGICAGLAYLALQRRGALAQAGRVLRRVLASLGRLLEPAPAQARHARRDEDAPQPQAQPRFTGGGVPLGRGAGGPGDRALPGQGGLRYRG